MLQFIKVFYKGSICFYKGTIGSKIVRALEIIHVKKLIPPVAEFSVLICSTPKFMCSSDDDALGH